MNDGKMPDALVDLIIAVIFATLIITGIILFGAIAYIFWEVVVLGLTQSYGSTVAGIVTGLIIFYLVLIMMFFHQFRFIEEDVEK